MISRQPPSDERIGTTYVQGEEIMRASVPRQTRVGELIFALKTRLEIVSGRPFRDSYEPGARIKQEKYFLLCKLLEQNTEIRGQHRE
jgi:hypothetical protein